MKTLADNLQGIEGDIQGVMSDVEDCFHQVKKEQRKAFVVVLDLLERAIAELRTVAKKG